MAGGLQDAARVRAGLHRVRQGHALGRPQHQVDRLRRVALGGRAARADQLLLEQAPEYIDYLSIHWYVGNPGGDLPAYLAVSELIEDRLSVIEGLSRALLLRSQPRAPIPIAVDEWNVWYRATPDARDPAYNGLEETYDLADALVVAMHFNAFFRHARTVRMANLAQLVNVIAPMVTTTNDLLLQSTYYPIGALRPHGWAHRPRPAVE